MTDSVQLAPHLPAGSFEEAPSPDGMPTVYVARERLLEVCGRLRDDAAFDFSVLIDVVPVDLYPREPRFEISYLMLNPGDGVPGSARRLRVKVRVPGGDPWVPTLSSIWIAANWAEREAYDLYGIQFENHPDLRRILMPDDWEGFPMRKDYPVQIKEPVKTYEPLQVTEEEFVANIEASRDRSRR
jgi:NADH-quinone oxidoreductase subunit C